MPAPLSTRAFPVYAAITAEIAGNQRFDFVIVGPKGRGPQGFRYRIVLNSAIRGAESSLDLATAEGGLVVTARDVDGAGNDLDLIIKSAWSFTPVGVWINNHHGGFIKADANVYAPSIWAEGPFMLSANPPDTLQVAILLWHQSHLHPSAQRCPGERGMHQGFVELTALDAPSRLTADPQHTRGPPRRPL